MSGPAQDGAGTPPPELDGETATFRADGPQQCSHTLLQFDDCWGLEMPDALNPLLLMRLARGRRAARTPDPAEMGTAFGLDYILEQAANNLSAPEVVASAWASTVWFRRWLPAKSQR